MRLFFFFVLLVALIVSVECRRSPSAAAAVNVDCPKVQELAEECLLMNSRKLVLVVNDI